MQRAGGNNALNLTGDCLQRCPPEHLLQHQHTHEFAIDSGGRYSEMSKSELYDPRQSNWYRRAVHAEGRGEQRFEPDRRLLATVPARTPVAASAYTRVCH
mmetsp:Transcript_76461/g.126818  ORF Transcript_76461/g.126818 Transcript_76461/m.126818 type:complete len:100 (+) Transcript_76461:88-387(+)